MNLEELHVEPGHYYSPIPSRSDIEFAQSHKVHKQLAGIQLNEDKQHVLAQSLSTNYSEVAQWLMATDTNFPMDNTWYFGSDAITLVLMILEFRPQQILEIGSGYSTVLLDEVNKHWLDGKTHIISIDPDIQRVQALQPDVEIVEKKVQELGTTYFETVQSGDFLLIDSSHVLKAGSDVHFLFNELLPVLPPGVKIHIHDIFYPFEYPERWHRRNVAFNEIYALELLLKNSRKFNVLYWNDYLEKQDPNWFVDHMPECLTSKFDTGGIWLEVVEG